MVFSIQSIIGATESMTSTLALALMLWTFGTGRYVVKTVRPRLTPSLDREACAFNARADMGRAVQNASETEKGPARL